MVTLLLNNDVFTKEQAEIWERDVYLDTLDKYNNDKLNYSEYLPNLPKYVETKEKKTKASTLSERSISDQIDEETKYFIFQLCYLHNPFACSQNVWIVGVSYLMMFLYIAIAIGYFPNRVHSGYDF